MPKLVDHAERRRAIIEATWRLIAARGVDGVTMRDLASEAGYANGSLAHYFSGKNEIIRTACDVVLDATDSRIAASVGDARGLAALRAMSYEIMPLTRETQLEARIVVALWQRALTDDSIGRADAAAAEAWRVRMAQYVREAITDEEIPTVDAETFAALLMTTLLGMQITAALDRLGNTAASFVAQYDMVVETLGPDPD